VQVVCDFDFIVSVVRCVLCGFSCFDLEMVLCI